MRQDSIFFCQKTVPTKNRSSEKSNSPIWTLIRIICPTWYLMVGWCLPTSWYPVAPVIQYQVFKLRILIFYALFFIKRRLSPFPSHFGINVSMYCTWGCDLKSTNSLCAWYKSSETIESRIVSQECQTFFYWSIWFITYLNSFSCTKLETVSTIYTGFI